MGVSENSDGLERLRDSTKLSRLVNIRALHFLSSYPLRQSCQCLGVGRGGGGVRGEKWDRCLGGHKAPFSHDTNPTAWPSVSLSVSPSRLIFLGRNHVLFIHLHYP